MSSTQTTPTSNGGPLTEVVGGVLSPIPGSNSSALERCEAEIATALSAILTGSLPLEEALLYYTDWCTERDVLLAQAAGLPCPFAERWRRPACQDACATRPEVV
jgi:hypothetical protein